MAIYSNEEDPNVKMWEEQNKPIEFITIDAKDKSSSDSMSRSFSTDNEHLLKAMVTEWEKEIPYRRYELSTQDYVEDYTEEVQEILIELQVIE